HAAGDIAKGEKDFGKCKACHTIADGDTVIQKGGKTGPNLFGIVGKEVGQDETFKHGPGILAAKEKGLVWTEENLAAYIRDPSGFLSEFVGEKVTSKMTFKLKDSDDVAAYLASLSPAEGEGEGEAAPAA